MPKTLIALLLTFAALPADAATHIWTGTASSLFSDASNWRGGSPAGDPAADLSFPAGVARLTATNDVPMLTIRSLSISAPGYTIGGLPMTVTSGGEVTDSSPGPSTIACDFHLAGGAAFRSGGNLDHAGGLTVSGSIAGVGPVTKLGEGRLTFSGTQPNTYSGGTRVLDGELRLGKSDGVDAIAGNLLVGGTGFGFGRTGHLSTVANEQIPDSATIQVGMDSTINAGGVETVGAMELESGARIRSGLEFNSSIQPIGTIVLTGDITIRPRFNSFATTFEGDIALSGIRTVTSCEECAPVTLEDFRDRTPGAGLILRDGTIEVRNGSYHGPTVIESGTVTVDNPNTAVRLRGGTFWGSVASLFAEGGTVNASAFSPGVTTTGDFRLSPAASVQLGIDAPEVKIQVGGALDFGYAKLLFGRSPHTWQLGNEYRIVRNDGAGAIRGTFSGVPEGTLLQGRLRVSYTGGDGNDLTLTEAGRYPTGIALQLEPFHEAHGDTVTLRARVISDHLPVFVTEGILTFRDNGTVIGTAALNSSGFAVMTFTATWGSRTYTVSYDGNAELAPSTGSIFVTITPPVPVLTSVEPSTVPGGTTVTLTLRGSGFLPNGLPVADHDGLDQFTWISSTEVQATWSVPRSETDRTVEVWYSQPEPGNVRSNSVPLLVKAAPIPRSLLLFEQKAVAGLVAPGGGGAWMSVALRRANFRTTIERKSTVIPDTDQNGLVRWEQTEDLTPHSIWLMTDMTTGRILAGKPDGSTPDASPFPEAVFLRDAQGHYSHLIFPYPYYDNKWDALWVRPGVGAWTMTIEDGGALDLDRSWNGHGVFNVSQMTAVSGSPAPPAGVEPGDVLLGIDWGALRWFGDRVDTHLGESNGPGTLLLVNWNAYSYEGSSVPWTLLRVGGTDGQVSVHYQTVNGSALAGVHYEGRAGTVTFGPGEILKTVEIPLIDDQRFLGDTQFDVVLSEPAGTTITGPETMTVHLDDNDTPPHLFVQDATVTEGDHGTHELQIAVTLTGTAHVPVTATWEYEVDWIEHKGELTFLPGGPTTQTISFRWDANEIAQEDRNVSVRVDDIRNAFPGRVDGMVTIVDDDEAELTILDATVSESGDEARVTIAMAAHAERAVSVRYTTMSGSATAGIDFTATTGTAWLFDEEILRIPIVRDTESEGDEWFTVVLSDVTGARLSRDVATVVILDDESNPLPVIAASAPLAAEVNSSAAHFPFRLSFAVPHEVRFRAATMSGSATAGADFVATNEMVVIPAGETEALLSVPIENDGTYEGTETFTVRLSEAVGATIGTPTVSATIYDLDPGLTDPNANAITVSAADVVEGSPARFTVRLGRASLSAVTVAYGTADGTAVAPDDYTAASGTLTFAPGETAKVVEIAVVDDARYEREETFTLVLGNAVHARIGTEAAMVHVLDNDPVPPPRSRSVRR